MDVGVKIKPVFTSTPPPHPFYSDLAMAQILADVDFGLQNNIVGQCRVLQHLHLQLGILYLSAERAGAMHQILVCQNYFCLEEMEN